MKIERSLEVRDLRQQKKDLIKQLGITMGAYRRHFPKLPVKSRNSVIIKDEKGNDKKTFMTAGYKGMSLKQQVFYLEELIKIREENKEAIEKLEKEMKEKGKKETENEK